MTSKIYAINSNNSKNILILAFKLIFRYTVVFSFEAYRQTIL
ncbi:MAG: hypothetical protein WA440_00390 [Ignavibacteriaceae bacterium]